MNINLFFRAFHFMFYVIYDTNNYNVKQFMAGKTEISVSTGGEYF
jgi:hypothetical protein